MRHLDEGRSLAEAHPSVLRRGRLQTQQHPGVKPEQRSTHVCSTTQTPTPRNMYKSRPLFTVGFGDRKIAEVVDGTESTDEDQGDEDHDDEDHDDEDQHRVPDIPGVGIPERLKHTCQ